MARADAEGDEVPIGQGVQAGRQGLVECVRVADHVVGGRDRHERLGVVGCKPEGRGQDRGSAVAPLGLDQHGAGIDAGLAQLLGRDEADVGVSDDAGRREAKPVDGTRR